MHMHESHNTTQHNTQTHWLKSNFLFVGNFFSSDCSGGGFVVYGGLVGVCGRLATHIGVLFVGNRQRETILDVMSQQ